MTCPHCESTVTTERSDRTELGYHRFRCRDCGRVFNERTGTPFNRLQFPTDVVCLVVLWRVRYKLSLRGLAEMSLRRSLIFTHETVRAWECKLAPLLGEILRKRRHGAVGQSWRVDETYIKVRGQWSYLYRASDRDGNLAVSRADDLAEWSRLRWQVETSLAHLKTTMRMEIWHGQTVPGVLKELTVFAIVDNLVCLVMCQSSTLQHIGVERISVVDALRWLGAPSTGIS